MDLSFYAGDSRNLIINVTDENNLPIDLTNANVKWILTSQGNTILSKSIGSGITINNPKQGQFTIYLKANDTKNLSGNYEQAARVTTSSGESSIVLAGTVTISDSLL
jgi:hypothetical protein